MEYLNTISWAPSVGKFRDQQIANIGTWDAVPDPQSQLGLLALVKQVREGATTVTQINPLDPGDMPDAWREPEGDWGRVVPAGRR